MEVQFKVGNRRDKNDPLFLQDWLDGQIVNIRPDEFYLNPDGTPKAGMTCKSFCVMRLPFSFWTAVGASSYPELKFPNSTWMNFKRYTAAQYLGKNEWDDGYVEPPDGGEGGEPVIVRPRDWFIDYDELLSLSLITQAQYDSILDKTVDHIPITFSGPIPMLLHNEDVATRSNPNWVDRKGTIDAGGTYTVGTSQTYADWSTAIADLPADIGAMTSPGDIILQGNTTEIITESTILRLNLDTDIYTVSLSVHDDHVHNGGAYGSGHRIQFTTSDRIDTYATLTNNAIIEKLAIDATGSQNFGVYLHTAGSSGHIIVQKMLVYGAAASRSGIFLHRNTLNNIIRNNGVYGFTRALAYSSGIGISCYDEYDGINNDIYNNTCCKNTVGIANVSATPGDGTMTLKNNLCAGNVDFDFDDWNGGFDVTAKNVSTDTSSPEGSPYINWAGTGNMKDYTNNDFRMDSTDSTLDDGDDLSAIGSPEQFDDDVQGQTRDPWYIGFSELLAAPTFVPKIMMIV